MSGSIAASCIPKPQLTQSVNGGSRKNFWNFYSKQPDMESMLLNANADECEALDRKDVMAQLPDFTGLDVIDIGAGIGRFTSEFAKKARNVISTDFIKSFVEKSQELNSSFSNVSFVVSDAVRLDLETNSLDLVFTNWLLMYLKADECVTFLTNAMRWLRPGGYIHIRESCSQPSIGWRLRKAYVNEGNNNEENPSQYRYSSVYTQLLQNIRFRDDSGVWKLDLQWATSVPNYIERHHNWRQVRWIAKKVLTDQKATSYEESLAEQIHTRWPNQQLYWDEVLNNNPITWIDKLFETSISSLSIAKGSSILCFNPRLSDCKCHVDAHHIAEGGYNVWSVETNPFFYRTKLTKANRVNDQRVQFAWSPNLEKALLYCLQNSSDPRFHYNAFLGCEVSSELLSNAKVTKLLSEVLEERAPLLLLERDQKLIEHLENQFTVLSNEKLAGHEWSLLTLSNKKSNSVLK